MQLPALAPLYATRMHLGPLYWLTRVRGLLNSHRQVLTRIRTAPSAVAQIGPLSPFAGSPSDYLAHEAYCVRWHDMGYHTSLVGERAISRPVDYEQQRLMNFDEACRRRRRPSVECRYRWWTDAGDPEPLLTRCTFRRSYPTAWC